MEYDPDLDAFLSYNAAVQAIGELVRAGEPVPQFMQAAEHQREDLQP